MLQSDGRLPNAEIARALSVSEGTIRRRLTRLISDAAIRVVAVPEPEQMGYNTAAFIGLQVDPASVDSVADALCKLHETEQVSITTGSFDILISVNLESSEALAEFLHQKIGHIQGIRQTGTFVSLETRKRGLRRIAP